MLPDRALEGLGDPRSSSRKAALGCPELRYASVSVCYLMNLQLTCGALTRLHLGSCNTLPGRMLEVLGDP